MSELDVLVILGTDHHRFDRLVNWLDAFLEQHGSEQQPGREPLRALAQVGDTTPPRLAEGVTIVPYDELQRLMRRATAVVTHGGPATMLEVRKQGRKPLVVPRDPALGEHVDQHQQEFSRRMGKLGLITLCEERGAFLDTLAAILKDPEAHTVSEQENERDRAQVAAAVATTGSIIDRLAAGHRRRRL